MYLEEIGRMVIDWIHLDRKRDKLRTLLQRVGYSHDFSVQNSAPMLASPPVKGERLSSYDQNTKAY